MDKESPEYIKKQVDKSFQVAALNLMDPSRVKHPTKRNVKLIESFSLLPDLSAFPDAGGYVSVKFQTNPVPPSNLYDVRLDSGILRPLQASDEKTRLRDEAIAAHERDPDRNPMPEPEQDYEFFLVDSAKDAANFKRKYDIMNPDRDDENLYTYTNDTNERCFRFKRIRAYETAATSGSPDVKYDEEIVLAINDGTDGIHQRAAFYYPLIQRATIRPQRKKNIDRQRWGFAEAGNDEADMVDLLDVSIRDANEHEERERKVWIDSPYHVPDFDEEGQIDGQEQEDGGPGNEQDEMDKQLRGESGDGNESD